MGSVLKRLRRKKSKGDEFQITTSVSSLTIECVKEKWHPNNLSIVWDKANPKHSSTKPIPWQSGFKNPYRGIHVWPEPDPVKTKLNLIKNTENELLSYQDKPWNILVQNVSPSGRRKVIAAGDIDIADYISEEPKSYDLTVTLKPMTKNVVSGSMEFTLSSVILEDGLPRRTDKEIFDEFMKEAMEHKKKSLEKTSNDNSNEEGSKSSLKKESGQKVPVSDTSAEEKENGKSQPEENQKLDVAQEAAFCSNNDSAGRRKVSLLTLPALPPVACPARSPPPTHQAADASDDLTKCEVKEEKREDSCSSAETSPPSSEKASNCVLGQEPGKQEKVKSSPGRRKRNRRKKNAEKYPEEFNPFGEQCNDEKDSSSSESESGARKETPEERMKECNVSDGRCRSKDLDEDDELINNCSDSILKSASGDEEGCAFAAEELEEAEGDDSDLSSGPELRTSPADGSICDEARPIPAVDPSFSGKETSVHREAASGVSHHCPKLSLYAKEQIRLIQEEIACLDKVSFKLESEMQVAINMKDCEKELNGLAQDWLTLIEYKDEVIRRKQELEILEQQENFDQCCNILRNELKLLLEVEDWRKTAEHRANEQRLLNILLSFVQFSCPTGLKL